MRELKFRVIVDDKIIGHISTDTVINNGAWYFVDYSLPEEEQVLDYCYGSMLPPGIPLFSKATYEQFTNKVDLEGNELFEGDLLDCGNGPFPIVWSETFTGYSVDVGNDAYSLFEYVYGFKAKKVGTIHD